MKGRPFSRTGRPTFSISRFIHLFSLKSIKNAVHIIKQQPTWTVPTKVGVEFLFIKIEPYEIPKQFGATLIIFYLQICKVPICFG